MSGDGGIEGGPGGSELGVSETCEPGCDVGRCCALNRDADEVVGVTSRR
jgi:hypothetical protein